jgi:hypothetical protein
MKIRKLRKKLSNKKWLQGKYAQLTSASEEWHTFKDFKCNSFFVGYEKSQYNQMLYDKAMNKIRRQISFIRSLLNCA